MLASEETHQLYCSERNGSFLLVARSTVTPEPESEGPEPWLCSLELELWTDLDGNGQFDPGEHLLSSSFSGEAVRYKTLQMPLPDHDQGAPHFVSVTYKTTTETHKPPAVRLP